MRNCILTVRYQGGKPVGVTATYGNGVYVGSFYLSPERIKALKIGGEFEGMRIKRIRRFGGSGGEETRPRVRPEFARLFEKFRIGTLHRPGPNGAGQTGEGWRVRCSQCHDPNSSEDVGTQTASAFVSRLAQLSRAAATAERALLQARRGGVETREALAGIEQAVESGIQLQVLVHSFASGESSDFSAKYDEGMEAANAALAAGRSALEELRSRRVGLLISLFFIALTLVGLYLKIRQVG